MKNEKGIALITLIIIVILTSLAIFFGVRYGIEYMNKQKDEDIKATMLAIQSVITNVKNRNTVDEENNKLVGIKIDLENNETEYKISEALQISLQSIENGNFYILNQEELNNLGVNNIEVNSQKFYIVDYNSEEIFYSLSINGKYKLSDM